MPRTLSTRMLQAIAGAESGAALLWICEISHASLGVPLRFVNNNEAITSGGDSYAATGFKVDLPRAKDGASFRIDLVIDNVDQWLTPTIRTLSGGFSVRLAMVTEADPVGFPLVFDNVEVEFTGLSLDAIQYSASQVRGRLGESGLADKKFPVHTVNPFDFRGAF